MINKILQAIALQYKPKQLVFHSVYMFGSKNTYIFHYKDLNNKSFYIEISESQIESLNLFKLVKMFETQLEQLCIKVDEVENV